MQIIINTVKYLKKLVRMVLADELQALRADHARLERELQEATGIVRELSATCHDIQVSLAKLSKKADMSTNMTYNFYAPVGTSIAAVENLHTRELYVGELAPENFIGTP